MHIYFCRCSDAELVEVIVVSAHKRKINSVHRFMTALKQQHQCWLRTHTHTHTQPFNGPLSGTTRVGQYQKGKTNLNVTEARDSEWQWHQLGHMQVCTSLQADNNASTPPLFFTGWMPFLPPNQQCQSSEGKSKCNVKLTKKWPTNKTSNICDWQFKV